MARFAPIPVRYAQMLSPWQLDNQRASLSSDHLRGVVDLHDPRAGVQQLSIDGLPIDARLFQTTLAPASTAESLMDHYVRGHDLIATYAEQPTRPFRPQLYWRAVACDDSSALAALELIASVQTSLLDSRPEIVVESAFRAAELWRWSGGADDIWQSVPLDTQSEQSIARGSGSGCLLARIAGSELSCALLVPETDDGGATVACRAPGWVTIGHPLFTRDLEKGVILRARVRAVLLPRQRDTERAQHWYCELLQSELPLTA